MATSLESWPRPHFEPEGGYPFLLNFVFGRFDAKSMAIDATEYRTTGIPDGIAVNVLPTTGAEAKGLLSGHFATMLEENPELARAVRAAPHMLLLRGELDDYDTLDYLRDTVGTLTALLENGGVGLLDAGSFRWYSPQDFRDTFFTPAEPVPFRHVSILLSREEDGEGQWVHTRGMRKFGRADISVHHVTKGRLAAVIELCNRLIEMQALGAVVPDGQEIRMESLPEGLTVHHAGDLDDPEFNNVHLEVRWPDDVDEDE